MKKEDFYYDLPEELIAQFPIENRDKSRLLVYNRKKKSIEHKVFDEIIDYLEAGDCLVLNDTRVMPARIFGNRLGKEESIEILLLKRVKENIWEVMVRPGKKARPGHVLEFGDGILTGEVLSITETGTRHIDFKYEGIFEEILNKLGEMPLPPYIKLKLDEPERYQTVYSKHMGSAAAPTAGLHFTKELLEKIVNKGVKIAYVTLHVGLGTFKPVTEDNILDHHMHSEYCYITKENADLINESKSSGKKVISVGTTSTRTLESLADNNGHLEESARWTDIFIYPGYEFKVIDKLITNFHLPESTLLMLVSALATRDEMLEVYKEAIKEKYRFFSFGDAMFIE